MKKVNIALIVGSILSVMVLNSCENKQSRGLTYMPDMGESRAYETYALHDTARFTTDESKRGGNTIYYNSMPVPGTLRRGDLFPYDLANDSNGYKMSAAVKNPITDTLDIAALNEAGRLYNVNCGICHGVTGAGNGPLATAGHVGGVANLTLPNYVALADGTMFHVITFGKGVMGSYASQLNKQQRWEIVKYIRTLQSRTGGSNPSDSTAASSGGSGGKSTGTNAAGGTGGATNTTNTTGVKKTR